MTDIQVVSTHCVCHIEGVCQSHKDRIELTPWELQFLLIHPIQKGLLFHKPPPSSMIVNVIEHLKQSLSSTLNIFYPLAGRFVKVQNEDNTTHFFVNCTNAGVEFVHAVADGVTVSDILDPIYVPEIICSFFLQNGTLNYDGISKPLLAIQVTEFVDGFFIGCTLNHSIADGTILWKFFNTWSEISRTGCGGGDNPISQIPPIFERQQYFNVRRDLEDWVQFPVLPRVTDLVLHAGDSLATGSSPRFNVYGNDFGWGRPLAVRSGNGNKSGGKITVFEGEEEGSIQFEVSLSAETLQALKDDADFMATVSTG
ncbi:HXXXD-type acyl-transferase family protein [Quillaja saponaria]|uniref:HXXXD-type acyl-transferase family protein n=1 Tax=Quillaja saponaria TaxID=32244 RepID=A0AAD7L486_QUISA|nr:HXXXD-type acyl-transferase family protein [Quillaja saponaria]